MWCCWPARSSSQNYATRFSYEAVASLALTPFICAVLICFFTIAAVYNWSLEVPSACIDDDRYDMAAECDAAGQLKPKLDLSD